MTLPLADESTRILMFEFLLAQANAGSQASWASLEAAHVLGQDRLSLHLRSHWHMLALAASQRDLAEVLGQVFRLALVPLGHLAGRLPAGNPGRANVSAFRPMPVRAELRELLARARAEVGRAG